MPEHTNFIHHTAIWQHGATSAVRYLQLYQVFFKKSKDLPEALSKLIIQNIQDTTLKDLSLFSFSPSQKHSSFPTYYKKTKTKTILSVKHEHEHTRKKAAKY